MTSNFGGRYGFPGFYWVFVSTTGLESFFFEARKALQKIFFAFFFSATRVALLQNEIAPKSFFRVGFWQNGFFTDFHFWAAGFFFRGFVSSFFIGKNAQKNPPGKCPGKILQYLFKPRRRLSPVQWPKSFSPALFHSFAPAIQTQFQAQFQFFTTRICRGGHLSGPLNRLNGPRKCHFAPPENVPQKPVKWSKKSAILGHVNALVGRFRTI